MLTKAAMFSSHGIKYIYNIRFRLTIMHIYTVYKFAISVIDYNNKRVIINKHIKKLSLFTKKDRIKDRILVGPN